MGIKHKITIHVSDPKGKSKTILKGANMKLPARIVRLLFGDYQQIYLLSPGQTVESVGVKLHFQPKQNCKIFINLF